MFMNIHFITLYVYVQYARNYSGYRLRINKAVTTVTFPLFQPPFQRISGTNDTSFESPNIGRSEFAKKLAVASF